MNKKHKKESGFVYGVVSNFAIAILALAVILAVGFGIAHGIIYKSSTEPTAMKIINE